MIYALNNLANQSINGTIMHFSNNHDPSLIFQTNFPRILLVLFFEFDRSLKNLSFYFFFMHGNAVPSRHFNTWNELSIIKIRPDLSKIIHATIFYLA